MREGCVELQKALLVNLEQNPVSKVGQDGATLVEQRIAEERMAMLSWLVENTPLRLSRL